jgi:hypothetical protein
VDAAAAAAGVATSAVQSPASAGTQVQVRDCP